MSIDEDKQADTPVAQIPDNPSTRKARAALQAAPEDQATEQHLNALLGKKLLLTVKTQKDLVAEELKRRDNLREDQAQAAMDGQPAAPGQSRTELQAWADKVKEGEHPFLHVPVALQKDFEPGIPTGPRNEFTRTWVNGAKDKTFNGSYYHVRTIKSSALRKAAESDNPKGALDAIVANWKSCGNYDQMSGDDLRAEEVVVSNWKGEEMPVELASRSRSILRQRAPQLVTVLVIVAGIAAWFYHSHEIDRRASEATEAAAAARESQANSIAARVKNSWNADDTWEDTFSSKGATYT